MAAIPGKGIRTQATIDPLLDALRTITKQPAATATQLAQQLMAGSQRVEIVKTSQLQNDVPFAKTSDLQQAIAAQNLAKVASTGDYADLKNPPAIPKTAADVGAATAAQGTKADAAASAADLGRVAFSNSYNDLDDLPTLLQGEKGDKGDAGTQGPQGIAGEQGAEGIQGPRGFQGPKGDAGPMGSQGLTGPSGPAGATGPQGPAGANGTNGISYAPQPPVARTIAPATAYQHTDVTKPAKVIVNARATQSVTLLALTAVDKVELRIGPTAGSVLSSSTGFQIGVWESGITGLSVMIGASIQDGGQLTGELPPGWYFAVNRISGNNAQIVNCFTQSLTA